MEPFFNVVLLKQTACKKPHEKTSIRREMIFFPKVSKTAVFGKIEKGGQRENFHKWPIFWANFGRLRK